MTKNDSDTMFLALNKDTGMMEHIDSVKRGLACNCICPNCKAPLEARQGNIRIHAFAHAPGHKDCMHGYETGLHLLAKEIISQEKKICLPGFSLLECKDDKYTYFFTDDILERKGINHKEQAVDCRTAEAEVNLSEFDIIPDVLIETFDAKKLMVEIYVTHSVDLEKQAKIRASGIPAIEIDLSKCDRNISKDELKHYLCETAELTHWCFNTVQEDHNNWVRHWRKITSNKHNIMQFKEDFLALGAYLPYFWKFATLEEWIKQFFEYSKLRVGNNEINKEILCCLFSHCKKMCSIRKLYYTEDDIKNCCVTFINRQIDSLKKLSLIHHKRPLYRGPRIDELDEAYLARKNRNFHKSRNKKKLPKISWRRRHGR